MVSLRTKFPARIRELPFSWRIFFSETTSIEIKGYEPSVATFVGLRSTFCSLEGVQMISSIYFIGLVALHSEYCSWLQVERGSIIKRRRRLFDLHEELNF